MILLFALNDLTNYVFLVFEVLFFYCQILEECKDIQWHFIGHLQKNKTGALVCK